MYESIYRFELKPGKEQELQRLLDLDGQQEGERLRAAGMVASYVFKLDKGGYMGVAVFETRDKYVANANDPVQDRMYRQFRELTTADPEWHDGEIVVATS